MPGFPYSAASSLGRYRMGFSIVPRTASSLLTVFIDYDLPEGSGMRALGWLLGGFYAGWCTGRMAADAARHFKHPAHASDRIHGSGRQ